MPYHFVGPTDAGQSDAIVVPDDALGEDFHGGILSEYCQLIGMTPIIARLPADTRILIFQYRKFVSLHRGPQRAVNQSFSYVCPCTEAAALFPDLEILAALEQDRLVGPCVPVRSLADQYAAYHLAEDLSAFALALSELEGFDRQRCRAFLTCTPLFPAPALGLTKAATFVNTMKILKAAWEIYAAHYLVRRTGYQRRVGGFLLERLQSFLTYEALASGEESALIGNQIVVSENSFAKRTV